MNVDGLGTYSSGGRRRSYSNARSRSVTPSRKRATTKRVVRRYIPRRQPIRTVTVRPSPLGQLFPPRLRTVLPYVQTNQKVQITTGVPAYVKYYLNSLFDPYASGSGHQPLGFDTYCGIAQSNPMYNRYLVHAALVEIMPEQQQLDATVSTHVDMVAVASAGTGIATPATAENAIEISHMWLRCYRWVTNATTAVDAPSVNQCAKRFFKISDIFGRPLDRTQDSGLYNGNPTNTAALQVWGYTPANSGTTAFMYTIRIKFYCEFYAENILQES